MTTEQAAQAVDDTMKAPPPMYDPMDDADDDDSVVEEYDQAELDYAMMERNDSGNAKRLYHRYGNDLVHVSRIGWHCWNGKYWDREEGDLEVMRRCRDVSTSIQGPEAAALYQYLMGRRDDDGNPKQVKKAANDAVIRHRKFGERSGDLAKIKAMTEISKVDLSRPPDALDKHPFMLSLGNGTITLPDPSDTSGKDQVRKRRFKRSDYISRIGNVVYDPDAECPQWRGFLNIVQPDPDIQRFLQSYMGYCLTGKTTEQVLVVNYGGGANGKSTFIETIARIMGSYSASVPIETFMADGRKGGGDATPDLVRLPGVRLVRAAEPEVGSRLSESLVKVITGGEEVSARALYKEQFTFSPQFKLVLSCNHKPNIYGTDDGIWRRILLIPWETTIPEEQRDAGLPAKLQAEASGILNWLLDGARMWAECGLHIPDTVRAATSEYRQDSDPVGQFLEICTAKAPGETVTSARLFEVYERYCRANAIPVVSQRGFNKALQAKGYVRMKSSTMMWKGLIITDDMGLSSEAADSISATTRDSVDGADDDAY